MKVTVDFPSVASEKQSGCLTSFNYFWQQFKEMKQNLISQTQRRALNSLTPPLDLNPNAVIIHYGDHCLRKAFNISTSFLTSFLSPTSSVYEQITNYTVVILRDGEANRFEFRIYRHKRRRF